MILSPCLNKAVEDKLIKDLSPGSQHEVDLLYQTMCALGHTTAVSYTVCIEEEKKWPDLKRIPSFNHKF